jgi:hypothetical protein
LKRSQKERADTAVLAALALICVDQFRQAANASANLTELKKISFAWDRETFIEKGGWAIMPGRKKVETLGSLKAADLP